MRIIITGFIIITLNIISYSQGADYKEEIIDSTVISFKDKWKIPGISVAIANEGKLIYAKGFGFADTITKEPVTPESLFRTGSCAKTITALGVMKLVEDKKISLKDTVFGKNGILNDHIYQDIADERVYLITVENLLQQTVGWPDIDIIGENVASYALNTPIPSGTEDNVKYILQQKHDFSPTTAYRYSDFNYLFLGEIITEITGRDHTEYIKSEILHPIGANKTFPGKSKLEERAVNEVIYYDYNGEMIPSAFDTSKIVPESYAYYMKPMISSGGWISCPIDMIKIVLSMDGLNNPPDILSEQSMKIMSTPPGNIKTHYAMGMISVDDKWFHNGAITWGTSAVWFKGENNICLAITCNTLPTTNGTEEEKYAEMSKYLRELIWFLPKKLEKFNNYSDIDLFDKYN